MKNKILFGLGLLASTTVFADTGSFDIQSEDFQNLYNNFRQGQPKNTPWPGTFWPYGYNGIDWDFNSSGMSPAAKFDKLEGLDGKTVAWEKANHSCDVYTDPETKKGCKGWYGHCNAWSAAAIKEAEPRKSFKVQGVELNVGDQKAFLTELWMDTYEEFAGHTSKTQKTGAWIKDPNDPISKEMADGTDTNYEAFWDLSPKSLFLLMTNYLGVLKVGVVIDRFTGDQVWNQPLVGYQIAKLSSGDLGSAVVNGDTVYYAKMSMTLFWADDGVYADQKGSGFDIKDPYKHGSDYADRTLGFKLFFDAPVKLDSKGNVVSAGNMVGTGIWAHQENPDDFDMDQTHPDFVWMPTNLGVRNGYGNIYTTGDRVYPLIAAGGVPPAPPSPAPEPSPVPPPPVPVPSPAPHPSPVNPPHDDDNGTVTSEGTRYVVKLDRSSFPPMDGTETEKVFYGGKVFRRLRDGGITASISMSQVEVDSSTVSIPMLLPNNESLAKVLQVLASYGIHP